jgi:LmbE family N-acetylglucosaminyl deacetylase
VCASSEFGFGSRIYFGFRNSGFGFPGLPVCLICLFAAAVQLLVGPISARADEPPTGAAIARDLQCFREMGSVLYIAAHPDDENTQLITYLARARNYRTAYLSLTRGDGGQNLLGPEFGELLGVARTQELLAARRLDGGQQFFTRAIDFGFSKDYRETLQVWDHQQVLADIVRVIRSFRPDVIITRFSPQPSGTHGHHTASAVLALEAFKLSGDPKAFPEQLGALTPWQPKRILMNGGGPGRGGGASEDSTPTLRMEIDGNDPVSGESFATIAGRSRAMHKTQGFGNFGGRGGGGARSESFRLLDGQPATNDILDGVDTTWGRVPDGAEIGRLTDEAIAQFNPQDPAASVPALLAIRSRLSALGAEPIVNEKRVQLDHILTACLGLSVETMVTQPEVVPGEELALRHTAMTRSNVPVRWKEVRYPASGKTANTGLDLHANQPATQPSTQTLPPKTPLTQPYWLREEPTAGMFQVSDPSLIGRPENPPAFPIEYVFEVGGQTLVVQDEPVAVSSNPAKGQTHRRLDVIAPVSLSFASDVQLFAPGAARSVAIEVNALRPAASGTVQLDVPAGWHASPASQTFKLEKVGDHAEFTSTVTAPSAPAVATISAHVDIQGARFDTRRVEINYSHLPLLLLQPRARIKAVTLDLATRGRQIGYVPGAGDSVAENIEQMGYTVTRLRGADLTPERLRGLDAVVIGIRAFNTRTDLAAQMPSLFAYIEGGGNVIVQYNRPEGLKVDKIAPYDLKLSQERVCEEQAPVTVLAPDHPALTSPNKITNADFEGWVQERGVYFPNKWDEHFTPVLECSDTGEPPKSGGLLIAHYGKGYFVYTGLAWFRQLPAGVPGAYRLFANLLSLGK